MLAMIFRYLLGSSTRQTAIACAPCAAKSSSNALVKALWRRLLAPRGLPRVRSNGFARIGFLRSENIRIPKVATTRFPQEDPEPPDYSASKANEHAPAMVGTRRNFACTAVERNHQARHRLCIAAFLCARVRSIVRQRGADHEYQLHL